MGEFRGKYVLETEIAPKHVTGVNFAINGNNVILSFFEELPVTPSEFTLKLDGNGNLLSSEDKFDGYLTRVIRSRVILNKEEALTLFRFVSEKLEEEQR